MTLKIEERKISKFLRWSSNGTRIYHWTRLKKKFQEISTKQIQKN